MPPRQADAEALWAAYEPALEAMAAGIYRRCPSLEMAELVQIGWCAILRRQELSPHTPPERLLRSAENAMKARLRTERRRLAKQEPLNEPLTDQAGTATLAEPRLDLCALMREAQLRERERAVVLAVYRDGLSLKEAGDVLGESRVYEIHQVALRKLAPVLADHLVVVLRVSAGTAVLERPYWGKPIWRPVSSARLYGWGRQIRLQAMPSHPEYETHMRKLRAQRESLHRR